VLVDEILHRGGTGNSIRSGRRTRLSLPPLRHKRTGRCAFQSSSAFNAEPSLGLFEGLRSLFFSFPLFLCGRFQVTSPSIPFH
jgi:hypothetical protein